MVEPYDQDAEDKYTEENYEKYRTWFEEEYTSKDPALLPANYDYWRQWNKAMDKNSEHHYID